jgi:hypothetical protein
MPCRFKPLSLLAIALWIFGVGPGEASLIRYVSFSMPEPLLKEQLRAAGKGADERVLFRGLPEPGGYPAFIRQLIPLIRELPKSERPRISIDPKAFEQADVSRVPVLGDGDIKDTRQARYPVTEKDPRIGMRDAVSRITPAMWKAALLKDPSNRHLPRHPRSLSETHTTLEPVYRLPHPLKGADGRVLLAGGQSANPLEVLPTEASFWIVDPEDARQLEAIRTRERPLKGSPILLLSGLQPGKIDGRVETLFNELKMPVYPVPERWLEQLQIGALPAEVRTRGSLLVVRQWQP